MYEMSDDKYLELKKRIRGLYIAVDASVVDYIMEAFNEIQPVNKGSPNNICDMH